MTNEEKFLFDLQGYLVIKNVLTDSELDELNAISDGAYLYDDEEAQREASILGWGKPFKNLIDHPRILPYLVELMGPTVRLDHDYCIFMREGERRGGLHGGYGGDHWYNYRNGVIHNGLSVVTYFLSDAPQGAGGFACVPGSHKSNCSVGDLPPEVRSFEWNRHYVVQPAVEAGDVLFFTEALMHGTMLWRAKRERRALLYKYSPGYSSWVANWYDFSRIGELTHQQKRLMAPPSGQDHPHVILDK